MSRFDHRSDIPELMDAPDADHVLLYRTLAQFSTMNMLVSRSRLLLRRHVLRDASRRGVRRFSIADVGAGSGDIMLWLARACRKRGIRASITCLDADHRIAAFARTATASEPSIAVAEARAEDLGSLGPFDYVFSNHVLHHIPTDSLPGILEIVAAATRRTFIMNDLRRSRLAYVGFAAVAGLFFRGSFTYTDGLRSILRAFRAKELRSAVEQAGVWAQVQRLAPARLVVVGPGTAG